MKPLIAALVLTMALAGPASAQCLSSGTALNFAVLSGTPQNEVQNEMRITDAIPIASSAEKNSTELKVSRREYIANRLQSAVLKIVSEHVPGATEQLRSKKAIDYTATIGAEHCAIDQQSVNIHITYDARPVGGILNIRVELVPIFGGIGAAVRPTMSKEFAQAVDNFDDDFIGETISKLSVDLAADLATK